MKFSDDLTILARKAFAFGFKLGVLENLSYDNFEAEINAEQIEAAYQSEIDRIPRTIEYGKIVHFRPDVIRARVWLARHTREWMLGMQVLKIARKNGLLLETTASWPELSDQIFTKLKNHITSLKARTISQELINKYFRRLKLTINGKEYNITVDNHHPFELVELANTIYEKQLGKKTFVEVRDAVGLGFLLINKNMVRYEKNPFIPFFYKNHPELINRAVVKSN